MRKIYSNSEPPSRPKGKKGLAVVVLLLAAQLLYGQDNGRGTRIVGLANAGVAVGNDLWSVHSNPAGIGLVREFRSSVFFVPEQFGLKELRIGAIAQSVPLFFGTFALSAEQFGFALYRESDFSVAFGRQIDWDIFAGVAVNAKHIAIERYGSTLAPTIDVGLLARFSESFHLGCSARNVLGAKLGERRQRLPRVAALGAGYSPMEGFLAVVEFEKDARYAAIVKAGVEQGLFDIFYLRAGVSTNPDRFSAGLTVRYSVFEFGYAGYSHTDLGWTHQLEIAALVGQ